MNRRKKSVCNQRCGKWPKLSQAGWRGPPNSEAGSIQQYTPLLHVSTNFRGKTRIWLFESRRKKDSRSPDLSSRSCRLPEGGPIVRPERARKAMINVSERRNLAHWGCAGSGAELFYGNPHEFLTGASTHERVRSRRYHRCKVLFPRKPRPPFNGKRSTLSAHGTISEKTSRRLSGR